MTELILQIRYQQTNCNTLQELVISLRTYPHHWKEAVGINKGDPKVMVLRLKTLLELISITDVVNSSYD